MDEISTHVTHLKGEIGELKGLQRAQTEMLKDIKNDLRTTLERVNQINGSVALAHRDIAQNREDMVTKKQALLGIIGTGLSGTGIGAFIAKMLSF